MAVRPSKRTGSLRSLLGTNFESRLAGETNCSVIEQIDKLMPADGDERGEDTAPIFQHVNTRAVELTAGSKGLPLA